MERGLFPISPKYKVQGAPGSPAELAAKRSEALKTKFRSDIEAVWKKPN
jgi:hypothetical protein